MSTPQAARGNCAPTEDKGQGILGGFPINARPFPLPDFMVKSVVPEPGTRVRLRDRPEEKPATVESVLTERSVAGKWDMLRLVRLERSEDGTIVRRETVVDPAHVFVLPSDNDAALERKRAHLASLTEHFAINGFAVMPEGVVEWEGAQGAPKSEPKSAASPDARWGPITSKGRDSVCGRFRITYPGTGLDVEDLWTGEKGPKFPTTFDVEAWCDGRKEVPFLVWDGAAGGPLEAVHRKNRFSVRQVSAHNWVGSDPRPLADRSETISPVFLTAEQAKLWCAVRASCAEHADTAKARLRYEVPIPF